MRDEQLPRELCRKIVENLDCFSLVELERTRPERLGQCVLLAEEAHDELLKRLGQPVCDSGAYWCYRFCAICVGRNLRAQHVHRTNNKRKFG